MNPLEALRLQLRLEGFEVVSGNRLRQVEVVPGEEMPLMILTQLADWPVVPYFDESLDQSLYQELMYQTKLIQFPDIDLLINVLNMQNIPFQVGHYRTHLFPEAFLNFAGIDVECRSKNDSQIQGFGFGDFAEHIYVIQRGREIVSACVSTREDKRCAEAWVYTDPPYRHQGLAQQVVSAWARDVLAAGKVPFYSYKVKNCASAGLAGYLGLLPVFEEMVISHADVSSPS